MRLKFEQKDFNPSSRRVWLDDLEITPHLLELHIEWSQGSLTVAELRIAPGEVEIDAETAMRLVAIAKAQQKQGGV